MLEGKFYSKHEAAKFLKISGKTLQRLRKSGKLIPERLGSNNAVFYSDGQLKRFKDRALVVPSVMDNPDCPVADAGVMVRLVEVLPSQHFSGVTKLMKKLQVAEVGRGFKTAFDKGRMLFIFARLDYADERVSFSG